MLTKDFIKDVEELGYGVDNEWPYTLYVETPDDDPDIIVAIDKKKSKPISWHGCTVIPASDAVSLVKLVEEYENTPLEEREEAIASKTLQDYELEELCEAIAKKLLKEYDPNVQVVISQERIHLFEPKWSVPSE
ncbi:hypothetical protein EnPhBC-611_gp12 [Enterococcus phage BC611]|uniref:BPL/LPL catalytic domain-containing protein n=1 Tax=Enterococcus phage BC611 TaxID=1173135 RepID=I4DSM6_9CAUD|nr:hypothetical protein EnPhBC-611_gp12 [Enterococcus phage BC611]BAM20916.1 hypothetical protein [Enterococcus phage BC611]